MHRGVGGFDPPPKPAKKCIGWVEKTEKGKKRGKVRQKIGKIILKIEKRGENRGK